MISLLAGRGRQLLGLIVVCAGCLPVLAAEESPSLATAPGARDARLACPPEEKVKEAATLVRAAYEAAYQAATETGEPEPLIEQLVGLARQTPDPAQKYALLMEAEAIATQSEDYATAVAVLATRAEQFQIDGLKQKEQLLKRLAGPRAAADLVIFDQAAETAEQAMQAERYDVAAEAAGLAVSVANVIDRQQKAEARKQARLSGANPAVVVPPIGQSLVKQASMLETKVAEAEKLFSAYTAAIQHLAAQPDDPAAHAAVARYRCFVRGEWEKGLPALARSDLEILKDVAAREIALSAAGGKDRKEIFALAGEWWSAADSNLLTANQQAAIKDHAATFYAGIVTVIADPLEKQLATSRLRGLGPSGARADRPPLFLADLPVKRSLVGWDQLRMGRLPDVRVNGRLYDKLVLAHAASLVVFELPAGFEGTLQGGVAIAGLSKDMTAPSSCRFRILGDDTLLWQSGVIAQDKATGGSRVEQFSVSVAGMKTLNLEIDSLGANHSDWSVWVDPVLVWKGSATNASGLAISPERDGEPRVPAFLLGKAAETFTFKGHTYWFPEKRTSQIEAKLDAEKIGGALVVIDDQDENAFVAKHARGASWIGIGKSSNGIVQVSGGGKAPYFSWDTNRGQPSNFAGEVAVSTNEAGLWHDHYASDVLYYVVEWPAVLRGIPSHSGINAEDAVTTGSAEPDPGSLFRYRASIGKTLAFSVTGAQRPAGVWGSNPYTADSRLASAAVHAGVLKPGESGVVRVTVLAGESAYPSSARNGVTTGSWGPYGLAYRIETDRVPRREP